MYEIIKEEGDLFALRAYGHITIKDYDYVYKELLPKLEERISKYGKINFLIDLRDVDSIAPEAWLEEFKLSIKYGNNCRRIAILGKKVWMDELLEVMIHLIKTDFKFFDAGEEKQAWEWINRP